MTTPRNRMSHTRIHPISPLCVPLISLIKTSSGSKFLRSTLACKRWSTTNLLGSAAGFECEGTLPNHGLHPCPISSSTYKRRMLFARNESDQACIKAALEASLPQNSLRNCSCKLHPINVWQKKLPAVQ